jgi:hypothetical protein
MELSGKHPYVNLDLIIDIIKGTLKIITNILHMGLFIKEGKNMVTWLTFDILKTSHFTLATILAIVLIIEL